MKRVRVLWWVGAGLAVGIAIGLFGVYWAFRSTPAFYVAALPLPAEQVEAWGKELEREVAQLHNDVQAGERWQLILTDQQINGWLIDDLPQKFPQAVPGNLQQPRVVFQQGKIQFACQVETAFLKTVVSLALEPYLTDDPHQIAIRITKLRAGRLPMPMKRILEQISTVTNRAGVKLQWSQDGGDPVAILRLPRDVGKPARSVVVESLRVDDGRLSVGGRLAR